MRSEIENLFPIAFAVKYWKVLLHLGLLDTVPTHAVSAAAGHEHGRAVAQLRGTAGAVQQRAEAGRAQHRQAAAPVELGQVQVGHCLCNKLYSTLK